MVLVGTQFSAQERSAAGTDFWFGSIAYVYIEGRKLLVSLPNAFTPDGDGVNDSFAMVFEYFEALTYNMKVFNRLGTRVFNTDSVMEP
ncbi:MAG: hypothetical protein Roseis2KO_12330 [Roseivirga sp.]